MTQMNMKFRGFWIVKLTAAERAWVLSTWWSGWVLITLQNQRVGNLRKTCRMPLILSGHSTDHILISQSLPDLLFIFFTHPIKKPFLVGSHSETNYKTKVIKNLILFTCLFLFFSFPLLPLLYPLPQISHPALNILNAGLHSPYPPLGFHHLIPHPFQQPTHLSELLLPVHHCHCRCHVTRFSALGVLG